MIGPIAEDMAVSRAPAEVALRVIGFAPYPEWSPSTRFRLAQYREALAAEGIDLDVDVFFSSPDYARIASKSSVLDSARILLRSAFRRRRFLEELAGYDLAIVHRELSPVFDTAFLASLERAGLPFIYDFDDAVYLPPEGGSRLLRPLRRPGTATVEYCRRSARVLAGNEHLAEFARQARASDGGHVSVLPTVVDTEWFRPPDGARPEESGPRIVGWSGSHTTIPYLTALYPALQELRRRVPFRLLVVSNREPDPVDGLEVEFRPWDRATEVQALHCMDIGVYPLQDSAWTRGKCGFKAIQYLACGVPTIASPVGVIPSIVRPGETGLLADSAAEWQRHLHTLLTDRRRRLELGRRGRILIETEFSVSSTISRLAAWLFDAAGVVNANASRA